MHVRLHVQQWTDGQLVRLDVLKIPSSSEVDAKQTQEGKNPIT